MMQAMRAGARLPIVEHLAVRLSAAEKSRIVDIAGQVSRALPGLADTAAFGPLVAPGLGHGPNLVFEDHSSITMYDPVQDERFAYRAFMLAGEGDIVALSADRNPAFEAYCRETLGLGEVEVWPVNAGRRPAPLPVRCARDPAFVSHMADLARKHGGLTLVPYMGDGRAWALARAIAYQAGVAIRVAAAPPMLTRAVNNKVWFEARVREVLGPAALPAVRAAHNHSLLAYYVKDLAQCHASVAIKVPAAASSLGNVILQADDIARRPLRAVREMLLGRLTDIGWRGAFPLLITAWEQPVSASPSVQIWIPEARDGMPVIEGIFAQRLMGQIRAFNGAAPADLADEIRGRLAHEAMQLAYLLQCLGYFGRCSFDAILLGDDGGRQAVHWVECNGRWGGVSIPMTLTNRLMGDWRRTPFVVSGVAGLSGRRRTLEEVIGDLGDLLLDVNTRRHGVVLLTPGPLQAGAGFDFAALAGTVAAAEALADEASQQLLAR